MKKFKLEFDTIYEMEIISETDKTVTYAYPGSSVKHKESKKLVKWYSWHDTEKEAVKQKIDNALARIEEYKAEIKKNHARVMLTEIQIKELQDKYDTL